MSPKLLVNNSFEGRYDKYIEVQRLILGAVNAGVNLVYTDEFFVTD